MMALAWRVTLIIPGYNSCQQSLTPTLHYIDLWYWQVHRYIGACTSSSIICFNLRKNNEICTVTMTTSDLSPLCLVALHPPRKDFKRSSKMSQYSRTWIAATTP